MITRNDLIGVAIMAFFAGFIVSVTVVVSVIFSAIQKTGSYECGYRRIVRACDH